MIPYMNIFSHQPVTRARNIVRDKTVTVSTTTHTHPSHVFVHLCIWFKNSFHRIGSISYWSNKQQVYSTTHTIRIIFLLVELEKSWFNHKFELEHSPFSFFRVRVRVRVRVGVQSVTHPYYLYITSHNFVSCLLLISTLFLIIPTLTKAGGC